MPWHVPQESFAATRGGVCERARVHVPIMGAGRQCIFETGGGGGADITCVSVLMHVGVHGCTCDVHVCHLPVCVMLHVSVLQ